MARRVLDTNVLIKRWRDGAGRSLVGRSEADVIQWAKELIEWYSTDAILTPVYIEFVAGVGSEGELQLAHAYLKQFNIVDRGHVLTKDWKDARRLAERVLRDGRARQLGDCLIRAICLRLNFEVMTFEKRFPR